MGKFILVIFKIKLLIKYGFFFECVMLFIDKFGLLVVFDIIEVINELCFLIWNLLRDDGGFKIINYVVERRVVDSDMWYKFLLIVKDIKFKVINLIFNKEYFFRVVVENMYGVGELVQVILIIVKYQFGKFFFNQLIKKKDVCVKFGFRFRIYIYRTYNIYIIILLIDLFGFLIRFEFFDIIKDVVIFIWCELDDDGGSLIIGYWVERLDFDIDKWVRCNKMLVKDIIYRQNFY